MVEPSPNLFARHPSALDGASDLVVPSEGAFPLTPQGAPEQVDAIRELLRQILEAIGTGAPHVEERAWFAPIP